MRNQYKVIGIDRDGGDCECCGRKNLRKLVFISVIRDGEEAEVIRVGSMCAAKMARISNVSSSRIETAANNFDKYPDIYSPLTFE